uniref:Uncharacterized protein n=1 Tax=Oryza sativa subsp. indica TaxID=39946 RepID=C5NNN7_ORYSI|nr:hypothetical protein [Oryza sativa Indica Group]
MAGRVAIVGAGGCGGACREARFLCAGCASGVETRVSVEGFSGCSGATKLATSWGLNLGGGGGRRAGDEFEDVLRDAGVTTTTHASMTNLSTAPPQPPDAAH